MKLKYLFISILILSLFSCKKGDSYDVSKITTFATFEYDQVVQVPQGTAFTPEVIAKEGENTIEVKITGNVDVNTIGVYELIFSAINAEGYEGSVSQKVAVYDPTAPDTDFSGDYTTSILRTESDGSNPRLRTCAAKIERLAPGIFSVDCLLGGYYSIGSGYGSDYAMQGYIKLESDNSITLLECYNPGFGDSLEGFENAVYDDVSGLPYWEAYYADGDIFHVTLTK